MATAASAIGRSPTSRSRWSRPGRLGASSSSTPSTSSTATSSATAGSARRRSTSTPCTPTETRSATGRTGGSSSTHRSSIPGRRPGSVPTWAPSRPFPTTKRLWAPPCEACSPRRSVDPARLQPVVHLAHAAEDLSCDLELALAARRLLDREGERLAELDRDLGEAKPLPLAGALGAVDADGDDRGAGFQGDAPDPRFRFAQLTRARTAALGVDEQHLPLVDEDPRRFHRHLVVVAAADREDAAVLVDVGEDGGAEELGFGHEADLPPQVDAAEEVVHLAEVVGGEDQRPLLRHVLDPDRPHPVEHDRRQREDDAGEGVGPADSLSRRPVELVEVLRRARVLVDLWLHLGHLGVTARVVAVTLPTLAQAASYAQPRERSTARCQSASNPCRCASSIRGSYRSASRHISLTSSRVQTPVAIPAR